MNSEESLEQSYLAFFKFLLLIKHQIFDLGAEYGLTSMQTVMLFLLDKPQPMYSFRNIFNCDAGNITGLVDGLVQKKLATRYENADDRRIKMVKLEAKGTGLRSSLINSLTSAHSPMLTKLTRKELQIFVQLLEKITKVVEVV